MIFAILCRDLLIAVALFIGVAAASISSAQTVAEISDGASTPQILIGGGADFAVTNANFGSIASEDTSLRDGVAYASVTIINLSKKLPVRIDSFYTDNADFRILDAVPVVIAPASKYDARISFHPKHAGPQYAHGFFRSDTIKTVHYDSLFVRVLPSLAVANEARENGIRILSIKQEAGGHSIYLKYISSRERPLIEVYSMLGERLLVQGLDSYSGQEQSVRLDPGALSNGAYILRLSAGGESISTLFQIRN